jgi:hypothetical protein
MKHIFLILGLALAALVSWSQVQITSFDHTDIAGQTRSRIGHLPRGLIPDISNRWQTLALVTNHRSLATTNPIR